MESLLLGLLKDGGAVGLCFALVLVFLKHIGKSEERTQGVFDRMSASQDKVAVSLDKLREHCFDKK